MLKVLIMTDKELAERLRAKRALIVHFSHHADTHRGTLFPADLLDAIEKKNCWPLSCHAVWPGHNMNLVGSVGIIFSPSVVNILTVDNCDSGSNDYGSAGNPLTIGSFNESFRVPNGGYNEWRIRGAEVMGVFVANPACILIRKVVPIIINEQEYEPTTSAERISLVEIFSKFPDLKVFTMGKNGPEELEYPSS